MEIVKETAKELAKSPCAGLGSGMMIIPPIFGQAGAPAAGAPSMALVVCPDCKAQIPASSKFCPNCGTNLITTAAKPAQAPTKTCPKCGEQASAAASFCPTCGEKLELSPFFGTEK